MSARKNLIIVRAGKTSLHSGWLDLTQDVRSYDLVVSYYDKEAFDCHVPQAGVEAVYFAGGKWDGLYKTLEGMSRELNLYEYVWLPDDDIETNGVTIEKMFYMMKRHQLKVGQPALTLDSYFTHFIFLQCHGLELRRTNYVEIMVPCLSLEVLLAIKPQFENTMSGFGLDYIWCRIPESGQINSAIIDSISVRHTRPVGQLLLGKMKVNGVDPKEEEARLVALFGIKERVTPLAYEALTASGKKISGKFATGILMSFLYLKALCWKPQAPRSYNFGRITQLLRRQFTRPLDLRPLTQGAAR